MDRPEVFQLFRSLRLSERQGRDALLRTLGLTKARQLHFRLHTTRHFQFAWRWKNYKPHMHDRGGGTDCAGEIGSELFDGRE